MLLILLLLLPLGVARRWKRWRRWWRQRRRRLARRGRRAGGTSRNTSRHLGPPPRGRRRPCDNEPRTPRTAWRGARQRRSSVSRPARACGNPGTKCGPSNSMIGYHMWQSWYARALQFTWVWGKTPNTRASLRLPGKTRDLETWSRQPAFTSPLWRCTALWLVSSCSRPLVS